MSSKILIQLDPDSQASLFDAVVAIDSDIDHLLQYRHVEPAQVRDLVHGAIFTRGTDKLRNTAFFVGGSDVQRGERLLEHVLESFFGPMRVSVMLDANGANTTAAAAVLAAERHIPLKDAKAIVLAGTGPVGQRVARILAQEGADVRLASRSLERATAACQSIGSTDLRGSLEPVATSDESSLSTAIAGTQICIAAGAAGIRLLPESFLQQSKVKVAVDLNAVPPLGIAGVDATDKAKVRDGCHCYGAIGVGGTKMKIHKAAVRALFSANDLVLDVDEIFALGRELGVAS